MTRKTPARPDQARTKGHPRNETDWRFFKGIVVGLAVMAALLPMAGHSGSRAVVHRTDVQVRATQACERNSDRDRAATPTRRLYSSSPSMPFRRWAYRLWKNRAVHACAKVRYLNAVPPRAIKYVFDRIGQADQALHVASYEAGSQDIWKHPYCTRVDNGDGFLGCFQMGDWARGRYGHGPTALDQAWAAFAYVRDARGWCSGWAATAWGC